MKRIRISMVAAIFPLSAKRREGCRAKQWQGESNEAVLTPPQRSDFSQPNYSAKWRIVHSLSRKLEKGLAARQYKAVSTHGVPFITIGLMSIIVFFNACSNPKRPAVPTPSKTAVEYTCVMHPQILEDHPGSCPICGMTLVKKSGQAGKAANISLITVLEPVNSSVISTVNAITPQRLEVAQSIIARGYLDFDTRTFNNIAARFSGRIEKLYIKYAFQEIHKGQRILDVYSPEMVTAQQDLIYLISHSLGEIDLINAAKQKLLLAGITPGQIEQVVKTRKPFYSLPVYSNYDGHVHDVAHSQMAGVDSKTSSSFDNNLPLSLKEGMYMQQGQTLFNTVDPHRLWAVIKVDLSAAGSLKLNQAAKITFPDVPDKIINGKVDFIEPALRDGDKTLTIRVYLDNMDHQLKVNNLVVATIQTGKIEGLWIPRSALVDLGQTKIVWKKSGPAYKANAIFTGAINGDLIQVKSGLNVSDSIAVNAQYLTDSESFIKTKGNEK